MQVTLTLGDLVCSPLQGEAWVAWNASYHEPLGEAYRVLASALYQQDLHERITAQLDRLDEQNARLDALLSEAQGKVATS